MTSNTCALNPTTGLGEMMGTSRLYHAWRPGYTDIGRDFEGLYDFHSKMPQTEVQKDAIITSDRKLTSYHQFHDGRQPGALHERHQKAPGHWKINYINSSNDYQIERPLPPRRSTTHITYRNPSSRTNHPMYNSPPGKARTIDQHVPFFGRSETNAQFGKKLGSHSFDAPITRWNAVPERRVGMIPRGAGHRSITNLSRQINLKPIQVTPTTAREHDWKLLVPEKAPVPLRHQPADTFFGNDHWGSTGLYRTSYQVHGQSGYTGAPQKMAGVYN